MKFLSSEHLDCADQVKKAQVASDATNVTYIIKTNSLKWIFKCY